MLNELVTFFKSRQILVPDHWVSQCIEWCQEDSQTTNIPIEELKRKVYEQWLLQDLRELETPSLPRNIGDKILYTLNGTYCLQINEIVDISKSKYSQLQQIRQMNMLSKPIEQEGESSNATSKRMLLITLTDGVQKVLGMEYCTIKKLHLNLSPGLKVRLIGPVIVRRGRLMLKEENIKIIGGEVEEIQISNAPENILARCLKLPENPNPTVIDTNPVISYTNNDNTNLSRLPPTPRLMPNPTHMDSSPEYVKPIQRNLFNDDDDDDLILAAEMDDLDDDYVKANIYFSSKPKTPDLCENDSSDINFSPLEAGCASSTQKTVEDAKSSSQYNSLNNCSTALQGDVNHFTQEQLMDIADLVEESDLFGTNSQEIVSIKSLIDTDKKITTGHYKIRARFKSVIEKFTMKRNQFWLVICVEDDSGEMNCQLHSNLISTFMGYTVSELTAVKNSVANQDKVATNNMLNALQKLKQGLIAIDTVLEVEFIENGYPIIISID